jgi:hypothetical protein
MTSKMIEAQAKPLEMCRFKFYKCVCLDEENNEILKTMVEIQIDTTVGKQNIALCLTNEQLSLTVSDLFDELYNLAITQWQNS